LTELCRKLVQLYVNFTRTRFVTEPDKTIGFVALPDKKIEKLIIGKADDKARAINQNWERIINSLVTEKS
jgi:hypothetical protein